MSEKVACYFSGLPADLACEADDLAPEERVTVERGKYMNDPLPMDAPTLLVVCAECADRGWDEVVPNDDGWDGTMPAESQIYPLDR